MNNTFNIISEIIRNRRSISPQFYKVGKIPDELLMSILESARWAPTHKKTQPWRFVVIRNDA
ncbi:MAG TPA: nitroreductase family protein, partial [Saprospiraceae bacterium]|nr:nitroreductase family protein [Saprospiraceae bacterium]